MQTLNLNKLAALEKKHRFFYPFTDSWCCLWRCFYRKKLIIGDLCACVFFSCEQQMQLQQQQQQIRGGSVDMNRGRG